MRFWEWLEEPPRRHGHWKLMDGGRGQCSECLRIFADVWDYDNTDRFCRHCGAKMDGGGGKKHDYSRENDDQ